MVTDADALLLSLLVTTVKIKVPMGSLLKLTDPEEAEVGKFIPQLKPYELPPCRYKK